ncbi:M90 family metallopeptidase, partial [Rubrivirga sp.]|uniref:M90 family metallopeptidase n=1 Tax=Rubrivirga sp. TaxID=1885344 RepID=UPI003C75B893
MRAFRPADLTVPAIGGAMAALLAGLVAERQGGAGWLVGLGVWIAILLWALRKPLRRIRIARTALPASSLEWLEQHVRIYAVASEADRRRFVRDVLFALDGLRFEAAGGATLTDDLQLSVAAGAAVLLHGHPDWELPTERTVLFVPDTFDEAYGDEEAGVFDGMVHSQGPIVLSTAAVARGWAFEDGSNVVLHELAHIFDFEGWEADGIPSFLDPRSADAWLDLMRREMRRAARGDGVLRSYAASAPAELFAVATEQFFERPARLRRHHPELFAALEAFYAQTPPD